MHPSTHQHILYPKLWNRFQLILYLATRTRSFQVNLILVHIVKYYPYFKQEPYQTFTIFLKKSNHTKSGT